MLVLSCLLLATSVLGAEYAPYMSQRAPERSAYPIDYLDNMQQKINPGSRFTYNFEQTRSNQPPQIEARDEDIGRYMYSNHQTTTTPGPSSTRNNFLVEVPEVTRVQPKAQVPEINVPMTRQPENHQYQSWNNGPVVARPPPPAPPALKWQEQDFQAASRPYQVQAVSKQAPVQWSDPSRTKPFLNRASEEIAPREPTVPQWAMQAPKSNNVQAQQPMAYSRGSHKFNWDEVAREPMTPTTSIPVQRQNVTPGPATQSMGPPPPPPTLSPWSGDNMGK